MVVVVARAIRKFSFIEGGPRRDSIIVLYMLCSALHCSVIVVASKPSFNTIKHSRSKDLGSAKPKFASASLRNLFQLAGSYRLRDFKLNLTVAAASPWLHPASSTKA